jgi:antitoxin PrlF
MRQVLDVESTLTDRYQTTIPETVRSKLRLNKRDKLHYKIMADGTVVLSRANAADESDPALAGFLAFLAGDLRHRPHAVRALGEEQRARAMSLTGDADVDLDAPLDPADE